MKASAVSETMFTASYRIYYEDTDATGVVYHSNYLKFAERARTEWLRSLGFEQSKFIIEDNVFFPVYRLEIRFFLPAKLDDLLTIETQLCEVKKASIKMRQTIKCDSKKITELDVSIACVNLEKKPAHWPRGLYQAFKEVCCKMTG